MPFARPTVTDLKTQIAADISGGVPGADALLRFSNLGVIGKALARLVNLCFGYLDWISRQSVPYTASDEFLEAWAGLKGVTRKAASAATGTASFTGTVGTLIPSGTLVVRGDGAQYTSTADATVAGGGTASVPVQASVAGATGNAANGTVLTLGSAIAGVQSVGAASGALTGGADVEADDAFRNRMLAAYRAPPQGGAASDYVAWALAVSGVTRAWCRLAGAGPGTVVVYPMLDANAFNGFPQGTTGVAAAEPRDVAATGDQLTVANAIFPLRPVTALVYVAAPVAAPTNFTISGIAAGSQAAVTAALRAVFLRDGTPGGVDVPSGQTAGKIPLAHFETAIAAVSGIDAFIITSPSADIQASAGQLPTLGTVTYL